MIYLKEYKDYSEDISILFIDKIKVKVMEKPGTNMIESENFLNYVFTDDIRIVGFKNHAENIGYFNAIKYGRIFLAPNPFLVGQEQEYDYVDNSMFFWGGFVVREEYQKMGYGLRMIERIFEVIPELENILLFAEVNVGKPFWTKIGAEKVLTLKEHEYDEIYDGMLKNMKVYAGDLELFILKREKFIK